MRVYWQLPSQLYSSPRNKRSTFSSLAEARFLERMHVPTPFPSYYVVGSDPILAQLVELDGTFGQHLALVFLRQLLGNHGRCPREKPIGMWIVSSP